MKRIFRIAIGAAVLATAFHCLWLYLRALASVPVVPL